MEFAKGDDQVYKLFIVDDEYVIRNSLCNYFAWDKLGYQLVGQAENGKKALDFIQSNPVDVLLCDIKMPVMSGIDLAKTIYEQKLNTKVVFLSAYRDFEYAQNAIKYKVNHYILKPTKYDEVVDIFTKIRKELDEERKEKTVSEEKEDNNPNLSYQNKIINTINTFVTEKYGNTTLEEAADLVHMNPFYLSKFYKDQTGENFSNFVIKTKMKKALELLGNISYRTSDVSRILGYSSPKNFTRSFKRYYGYSPSQYRYKSDLPPHKDDGGA